MSTPENRMLELFKELEAQGQAPMPTDVATGGTGGLPHALLPRESGQAVPTVTRERPFQAQAEGPSQELAHPTNGGGQPPIVVPDGEAQATMEIPPPVDDRQSPAFEEPGREVTPADTAGPAEPATEVAPQAPAQEETFWDGIDPEVKTALLKKAKGGMSMGEAMSLGAMAYANPEIAASLANAKSAEQDSALSLLAQMQKNFQTTKTQGEKNRATVEKGIAAEEGRNRRADMQNNRHLVTSMLNAANKIIDRGGEVEIPPVPNLEDSAAVAQWGVTLNQNMGEAGTELKHEEAAADMIMKFMGGQAAAFGRTIAGLKATMDLAGIDPKTIERTVQGMHHNLKPIADRKARVDEAKIGVLQMRSRDLNSQIRRRRVLEKEIEASIQAKRHDEVQKQYAELNERFISLNTTIATMSKTDIFTNDADYIAEITAIQAFRDSTAVEMQLLRPVVDQLVMEALGVFENGKKIAMGMVVQSLQGKIEGITEADLPQLIVEDPEVRNLFFTQFERFLREYQVTTPSGIMMPYADLSPNELKRMLQAHEEALVSYQPIANPGTQLLSPEVQQGVP